MITEQAQQGEMSVPDTYMREHARHLWSHGFNVVPMRLDQKAPALSEWAHLTSHFQTAQEVEARNWSLNIGYVSGANGVRSIDIDDGDFEALCKVLELLGLDYEYEWLVCTPGNGWHIHFICDEQLTLSSNAVLKGHARAENSFKVIELRWRHFTALPPSQLPETDVPYDWAFKPPSMAMARLSVAVVERMFMALATIEKSDQVDSEQPTSTPVDDTQSSEQPVEEKLRYDPWTAKALEQEVLKVHRALEGGRNTQLNKSAYALGQIVGAGLLSEQDAIDELTRAGIAIDLAEKEIEATLKSGLEAGKKKPRTPKLVYKDSEPALRLPTLKATDDTTLVNFSADDQGNADAIHHFYGKYIAYNDAYGWMTWNGTHFTASIQQINTLIVQVLRKRLHAAKSQDRTDVAKICTAMAGRVAAARTLLENLCHVDISEFDSDPDMINTLNGVVDLRTKKLYRHEPAYRFTWCSPVAYKPDGLLADDALWYHFLASTVPSQEVRTYLQKALGYSITGNISEEVLFYIFGPPRAGKGTLTETILAIFPRPIAMEVDFNTFTQKREGDTQNFDLAPMKAARLVFASESNKYQSLNPAKVKALTGGNLVYCAFKHKEHFSYQPQYAIWLSSNHETNADPDDDAIWSRVKCIEFPNSQLGHEDKSLKRRMQTPENLECVLAWLVEGAYQWYRLGARGLITPDEINKITNEQRAAQDAVGLWLEECCEREPETWTSNENVIQSYQNWCTVNGYEPKKAKGLSQSLAAKGFEIGVLKWIGLESDKKRKKGVTGLSII